MPGLADSGTVDLVAQDAAGTYLVIMVEDRPWGTDPAQPLQLQAKVNAYAGFILDGGLVGHYPETAGHGVSIQLDCIEEPTDDVAAVVEHARLKLHEIGIDFHVNVRN